jgi:hypothetical protein
MNVRNCKDFWERFQDAVNGVNREGKALKSSHIASLLFVVVVVVVGAPRFRQTLGMPDQPTNHIHPTTFCWPLLSCTQQLP